eukprot:11619337-Alexandrium_andersonii.AAC.1
MAIYELQPGIRIIDDPQGDHMVEAATTRLMRDDGNGRLKKVAVLTGVGRLMGSAAAWCIVQSVVWLTVWSAVVQWALAFHAGTGVCRHGVGEWWVWLRVGVVSGSRRPLL